MKGRNGGLRGGLSHEPQVTGIIKTGSETMHEKENTESVTLEAVLSKENMREAWKSVKANRGAPGVDGMTIAETGTHLKHNWLVIRQKLLDGKYTPGAVRAVTIPKAGGGKRQLGIPNAQDRLIQQAIGRLLSEEWENEFSEHSYGFRPGRSAHDAVDAASEYVKAGKIWVVDIDFKGFFDEVNHDILMNRVREKIKDGNLLRTIYRYLKAAIRQPDGTQYKPTKGMPQGGPLSPILANIYLHPLDMELEKRGVAFVRYADDVAIYASSERSAKRIYENILRWIEKNLRIPVNTEKSGTGRTEESALLGFRIDCEGQKHIAPKSTKRFKQKVRELWNAQQSLTSQQLREQWRRYITGWWEYFGKADIWWEVRNLSGWIRRHIRKCFWIRWKTPAGRINALKRLGIKGRPLGLGYTGLGAWRVACSWTINRALSNRTLRKYGFVIPWEPA